jgi:predicted nuclease of predicted toxin-antitoxin system
LRFKIDENLPREVAELLRSAGHEAATVAEEGLTGTPDEALAARVQQEQRGLVTLDLHFADIRTYPPERYRGIVVIRTRLPDKPRVLSIVRRLLPDLTPAALQGRLWIVEEDRVRMRRGRTA